MCEVVEKRLYKHDDPTRVLGGGHGLGRRLRIKQQDLNRTSDRPNRRNTRGHQSKVLTFGGEKLIDSHFCLQDRGTGPEGSSLSRSGVCTQQLPCGGDFSERLWRGRCESFPYWFVIITVRAADVIARVPPEGLLYMSEPRNIMFSARSCGF